MKPYSKYAVAVLAARTVPSAILAQAAMDLPRWLPPNTNDASTVVVPAAAAELAGLAAASAAAATDDNDDVASVVASRGPALGPKHVWTAQLPPSACVESQSTLSH